MNTLEIRMEGILNCMRKLHNDENVESRHLCVQLITSSSHAMGGLWTVDLTQNGFHQLWARVQNKQLMEFILWKPGHGW